MRDLRREPERGGARPRARARPGPALREAARDHVRVGLDIELPAGLRARAAAPADGRAVADLLLRGFETYSDWAPGWEPPPELAATQRAIWPRSLTQPDRWTALVERDDGSLAAVASFAPAHELPAGAGAPLPGVAHLSALFVDREWWGRGVAPALLRAAVREMAERGFERGRLIVPTGHRRARALYARDGWQVVGPWSDERIGLPLLELGRQLGRR